MLEFNVRFKTRMMNSAHDVTYQCFTVESGHYHTHHPNTQRCDQQTKHTSHQWPATATAAAARHACSSRRTQGCGSSPRRFESVVACHIDKGIESCERVVLAAGERGSPRWPAIATKTHKGHRSCGNRTYSPRTAAACYCCCVIFSSGSLGTSLW